MSRRDGFTLLEVLLAIAILGTAFVAIVSLQVQSLATTERIITRMEADLWAEDAYARWRLREQGYEIEPIHPRLREDHQDWRVEIEAVDLTLEDLPFVPVLPVGWQARWVDVRVLDADGRELAAIRPLFARRVETEVPPR